MLIIDDESSKQIVEFNFPNSNDCVSIKFQKFFKSPSKIV